MKWMCKKCVDYDPCILTMKWPAVRCPDECVYGFWKAEWYEVKEVKNE